MTLNYSIFITNRTVSDDVKTPCIGNKLDSHHNYFGPFSQVISYLGNVELPFYDMSAGDINFILSGNPSTSERYLKSSVLQTVKANWKAITDQVAKRQLLTNNFYRSQLEKLRSFVQEKDIFDDAIKNYPQEE